MGLIIARIGTRLLTAVLTEAVIIKILVALGDWLVKRSSNTLDDSVWAEVKKALGER